MKMIRDRSIETNLHTTPDANIVKITELTNKETNQMIFAQIQNHHSDSEICFRVGNDLSEWFSIVSGVRQGCVVAPDLFNGVIDHRMCQLKTAAGPSLGIELDNWRLTDMDYTDDIALFSPSSEDRCHLYSAY